MFARLALLGIRTVAGIVQLLPEDAQDDVFEQVVHEATDPQSSSHHAGMQALLGDGSVRFVSMARILSEYTIGGVPVLDSFWNEATQELKLGALREDWQSLPGVSQPPTVPEGVVIFSYDGLADRDQAPRRLAFTRTPDGAVAPASPRRRTPPARRRSRTATWRRTPNWRATVRATRSYSRSGTTC